MFSIPATFLAYLIIVPVGKVIEAAKKTLYTGHIGDGKIFVYDVEEVVKVRTGQTGLEAMKNYDN